ncbi:hypothetical protein DRP04_08075 [Archaeoglobales archaeon]|nr:MAG: hypothetical protein DRP04_08075 [Archaeoglobales archaeon]
MEEIEEIFWSAESELLDLHGILDDAEMELSEIIESFKDDRGNMKAELSKILNAEGIEFLRQNLTVAEQALQIAEVALNNILKVFTRDWFLKQKRRGW